MLSQESILKVNQGHVRLVENDAQTAIAVVPSEPLLIAAQPKTVFDTNRYFQKARREHKPFVAFQSSSGKNVFVCPTKPYASIRDFAQRASPSEWTKLIQFCYRVRYALQRKYGGHFYIETIGPDVPQLHFRIVRRQNVVYRLGMDAIAGPDQRLMLHYANDKDGWTTRFHCRVERGSDIDANVVIRFASPEMLETKFGRDFADLSVSVVKQVESEPVSETPEIFFNLKNWNHVPAGFTGTLTEYRRYLVQHELGHALYHVWDHDEQPSHGICPVMYQQTKGTATCTPGVSFHPHVWTLQNEKNLGTWLYALV